MVPRPLKAGSSQTSGFFSMAETGHPHQVKLASLKLVGWLIHSSSRTVFWLFRFPAGSLSSRALPRLVQYAHCRAV